MFGDPAKTTAKPRDIQVVDALYLDQLSGQERTHISSVCIARPKTSRTSRDEEMSLFCVLEDAVLGFKRSQLERKSATVIFGLFCLESSS